jgi:hypothetical protein
MLGVAFFPNSNDKNRWNVIFYIVDSIVDKWDCESFFRLNWHLSQSIPNGLVSLLAIKVFVCLHQQAKSFFHWCAKMAWNVKGSKQLLILILCSFYKQRVSMAWKWTQATFILKHFLIVDEDYSRLKAFPGVPALSLSNMFLAIGGVWVLDMFYAPNDPPSLVVYTFC